MLFFYFYSCDWSFLMSLLLIKTYTCVTHCNCKMSEEYMFACLVLKSSWETEEKDRLNLMGGRNTGGCTWTCGIQKSHPYPPNSMCPPHPPPVNLAFPPYACPLPQNVSWGSSFPAWWAWLYCALATGSEYPPIGLCPPPSPPLHSPWHSSCKLFGPRQGVGKEDTEENEESS